MTKLTASQRHSIMQELPHTLSYRIAITLVLFPDHYSYPSDVGSQEKTTYIQHNHCAEGSAHQCIHCVCFHHRSECSNALISLVDGDQNMEHRMKIINVSLFIIQSYKFSENELQNQSVIV